VLLTVITLLISYYTQRG